MFVQLRFSDSSGVIIYHTACLSVIQLCH